MSCRVADAPPPRLSVAKKSPNFLWISTFDHQQPSFFFCRHQHLMNKKKKCLHFYFLVGVRSVCSVTRQMNTALGKRKKIQREGQKRPLTKKKNLQIRNRPNPGKQIGQNWKSNLSCFFFLLMAFFPRTKLLTLAQPT